MRTLANLALIITFVAFLASCTTTKQAGMPFDEVYATRPPYKEVKNRVNSNSTNNGEASAYNGDYYDKNAKGDYKKMDEYYDNNYSSQIRRFSSPSPGLGYSSPYYSGSYNNNNYYGGNSYSPYSSGYDPFCSCYGYGGSAYQPYMGMGMGMGYGYGMYNYNKYNPFYSNYYNPYSMGYQAGYNNGFYNGYYGAGYGVGYGTGYGYGENLANSYFGPRSNISGKGNGSSQPSRPSRYGDDPDDWGDPGSKTTQITGGSVPATASNTGTLNSGNNGSLQKPASREAGSQTANAAVMTAPKMIYEKPQNKVPARTTASQGDKRFVSPQAKKVNITEPKYEKPKTYKAPKARTTASSKQYTSPSAKGTRTYSSSGTKTRNVYYAKPERKSLESVTSQARTNTNYTSPTRSSVGKTYTTPTRSTSRSYSSPSSGTRSYSSPSRSSGGGSVKSSGSGTRSSGSGGGSRGSRR